LCANCLLVESRGTTGEETEEDEETNFKFKNPKTVVDMMVRATTRAGTQKSRKSGKP
jgi:hypothetical protein